MALNREKIHQNVQKLVQKGQLDKAIAELRPILAEDAADTRTLQRLAEIYRKKGAYGEAEQTYQRLGEVLFKSGFYQRAVAVYNQILQLNPANVTVLIALGEALGRLGMAQDARKILQRSVHLLQKADRTDDAAALLERLVEQDPEDYAARLQLAELYLRAERSEPAIQAFSLALPILLRQGRDDLYERAAQRLLHFQKDNLPLCRELALFHMRRANVPQAMKLLQYCHKKDPEDVETLRLLAGHFAAAGETDKAVVVLRQMARVVARQDGNPAARPIWTKLVELQPGDAEALKALGAGQPLPPPAPSPDDEVTELDDEVEEIEEVSETTGEITGEATLERLRPAAPRAVPQAGATASLTEDSVDRPPPLPPEPPDLHKVASEADIFLKFGLKDRAIGHLTGSLTQYPDSLVLRDRLIAIHLDGENVSAAVRVMLDAANVVEPISPAHARKYLREVLFLDEAHPEATQRLTALRAGRPARPGPAGVPPMREPPPIGADAVETDDFDLDIEVAAEPVRTFAVPPARESQIPPLPPAGPPPGVPPQARVVALPDFAEVPDPAPADLAEGGDEVDDLISSLTFPAGATVLELDDEEFDSLPFANPDALDEALPGFEEAPKPGESLLPEGWEDMGLDEEEPAPGPDEGEAAGFRSATPESRPATPQPAPLPAAPASRREIPAPPPRPGAAASAAFRPPPGRPGAPPSAPVVPAAAAAPTKPAPAEPKAAAPARPAPAEPKAAAPAKPAPAEPKAAAPARPAPAEPKAAAPAKPAPAEPKAAAPAKPAPAEPKAAAPAAPAPAEPSLPDAIAAALEEIEFFLQQGLEDDARMLLEQLHAEHGADPRIEAKRAALGGAAGPSPAPAPDDAFGAAFDSLKLDASAGVSSSPAVVLGDGKPAAGLDSAMHFDLGVAYREMGVLDKAIDEFRLAGADPEREASCSALVGACLLAMGKAKEAVEEIKRGLYARHKTPAEEVGLYYELANAHLALNDAKETLFYLQKVKRMDPEFRDVSARIAALMNASRPGRRPAPRPSVPPPAPASDDGGIDEAFDDMFKGPGR